MFPGWYRAGAMAEAAGMRLGRGAPAANGIEIGAMNADLGLMVKELEVMAIEAPADREAELDRLAARYRAAGGIGMQVLNTIGGQAENLLDRLPTPVREGLDGATEQALVLAMAAAQRTRGPVPDAPPWAVPALTAAMGAAGGMGGLPTSLAELPATITLFLRSIQDEAVAQGFDPSAETVSFDCVRVFAAAGPLEVDDGADLAFVGARLTLTGSALRNLMAAVAPRLAAAMGQKLAAQAVPVLGAAAGAATNLVYARYYRQIANVHFGLRRLAISLDCPQEELVEDLRGRLGGNLKAI